MKLIALVSLSVILLNGQTNNKIIFNELNSKPLNNGIFMTLKTPDKIDENKNNVSGWYNKNGWFYLTVYDAKSKLDVVHVDYPIINVNGENFKDSFQLSVLLKKPIKSHEYYIKEDTLVITLYYD